MEQSKRIFEDMSRMAGGAASLLGGMRQQLQEDIRQRVEEVAARMDLVPRDEFDRLQEMVTALRTEQDELKKQIAALSPKKAAAKKPSAKKTTKKAAS